MSNKIIGDLEKIYTPNKLTDFLIEIIKRQYKDKIIEILEPAAGSGQMIDRIRFHYPNTSLIAYDILNETKRDDIIETDFLKQKIEYKKGRITIMNPPFTKGLKFIYKCLEHSDMVFAITSSTSFMNIDFDLYELKELYFIKKAKFSDDNYYPINILSIKKKDNYDFWN